MLGTLLALRGHNIITGGGAFGCMHAVQHGCRSNGGNVRGVVHQMFVDGGSADMQNLSDIVIVTGTVNAAAVPIPHSGGFVYILVYICLFVYVCMCVCLWVRGLIVA